MSYRPEKRTRFGPPWKNWLLPVVYLLVSLAFLAVIVYEHSTPSDSWLHRYVVDEDPRRIVGSQTLAWVFLLGGVASVVRTAMRGVVVSTRGIETREVFALSLPKVRAFSWTEVHAFVFEKNSVGVVLWNGEHVWLPAVSEIEALRAILTHVAEARAIPMQLREPVSGLQTDDDG